MSEILVGRLHEPTPIYDRLVCETGLDPCRDLLYRQNMQAFEDELRATFLLPSRPLIVLPDDAQIWPRPGFGTHPFPPDQRRGWGSPVPTD